jgi:hypothetical protein
MDLGKVMALITVYHYTSQRALPFILAGKLIRPSRVVLPNGQTRNAFGISLTTDQDPEGHGLPDGRRITSAQAKALPKFERIGSARYCEDATRYRLKLLLDSTDASLVHAPDYYRNALPHVYSVLEAKAYFPVDVIPPDEPMKKMIRDIQAGLVPGKGSTWWYYFGQITLDSSSTLEEKTTPNTYSVIRTGF